MTEKAPRVDELPGMTISGRYRIISRLGVGGMGTAYRAWDEQSGVPVVIKIPRKTFLEDPKFAERFRREIRLLRGLVHPHIVPIVDEGEHEDLPFVVMRFLPGGSLLDRRLRDEKGKVRPNPPGMLLLWLPAVAEALDYIHSQGVVHRDMKPANIFFDAGWGAFVGDFGIAKIIAESEVFEREQTLTATGMGIGTPVYMAPEQFAPKSVVDGRVDQYALAVIVYEMLAGVRPFKGESANLILEVMTQPVPRLNEKRSGLPPSLIAAVDRGLAKHFADRFATCREFAAAALQDVRPIDNEPDVARLLCPMCANLLKLPTSAAGKKGKCPKCQNEMKVADDLGAMWLLDEARRQEDAANVGGFELDGSAAGSDEQSLESFRSVSNTTPAGTAARRSRKGVMAWVDGHRLIMGGLLALVATIPWILLARRHAAIPSPGDYTTTQRVQSELEAFKKELADVTEREKVLQDQLNGSRNEVVALKAELAGLRSTPPMEPPETPLPRVVDLSQRVDAPRFPPDALIWDKNGHGYKVFKEILSWPQAKQRCEELGGHLVTITSPEEQQFVLSVISKAGISVDVRQQTIEFWHDKLWAGGTDEDSEGNWRWVDGSPWGFANWLNGAPQQDGNYLDICPHQNGCWNDGSAQDFFIVGFICEWPRGTAAAREESSPTARNGVETQSATDILALPQLKNSVGIELKLIPAGTFQMGSNDGEPPEKPVREVQITQPFYLGVTEVTNAQWKAVVGDVPSEWKDDNRPVEHVCWEDAVKFCEKLSALAAEKAAGRVYRLPTEAEWEYACRGGTKTKFSCGDDEGMLVDFAWFSANAGGQTHPVGQKKPNPWGLHDMHGNVWEWCSGRRGPYGAENASDPTGPATGSGRGPRGGCWGDYARFCRSGYSRGREPSSYFYYLGFRLALSPSGSSSPEAGSR